MQNYGLIRQGAGNAVLQPIPIPKYQDDYMLVRTVAIALNPTDWTTLDARGGDGTIVGCDYAGIVEEVGKAVTNFEKGDRVAGFSHGGNDADPQTGAFAKYIKVKASLQIHVPENMSFEAASTLGVGVATVGGGMYKILGLPFPGTQIEEDDAPFLIYGGSTATATVAIQLAKMSGRKVITLCSPKYFDRMKELGVNQSYDYHIPKIGEKIREDTKGRITTVFDTVSIESSAAICADAIGPDGGVYCSLLEEECPRTDVKSIFFLGYSLSGESFIFEGDTYPAIPEDYEFAVKFMRDIPESLRQLKPHPQKIGSGGLLGAISGMQEMREGKYSGEKLVYRVDETNWP